MVVIYVDERERQSEVPKRLQALGASVIFKMLDVGDYVVSERVGVERKSASDFVKSIVDGRLFNQVKRLSEAFEKPVIIVEGSLSRALRVTGVHRRAVIGAQLALSIDMGIALIFTRNPYETAEAILVLARREQEKRGGFRSIHVRKPRIGGVEEWQLYILQCFPHVGPKIARRILESYGSIRNFCSSATLSELARIEGLGESRASEILQILNAVYKGFKEKKSASRSIVDYLKKKDGSNNQQN
ncbi:MAG: hypothetical protein GXO32_06770 [Crenarchaeota archaeon]|nr:hypothetical protein [Thermoproteota archaeon]